MFFAYILKPMEY